MTQQTKSRYGGWLALFGLAAAAALAGYGIWSRQASVAYLQQTADDATLHGCRRCCRSGVRQRKR